VSDLEFEAAIGVVVKGETWSCVEVPGAIAFFGSGRSVRVDANVDGLALPNVGLMPTGSGGLMLSLSATVRAKVGKDIGDVVRVGINRR